MAYNQQLAAAIEMIINGDEQFSSKKMFGGVGFLLNGNMCVGVHKDFLILRLGEDKAEELLSGLVALPFDITGRTMKGWVMIAEENWQSSERLQNYFELAKGFVETLPVK